MNEPFPLRSPARAFEPVERQWILFAAPEEGAAVQVAAFVAVPFGAVALRGD